MLDEPRETERKEALEEEPKFVDKATGPGNPTYLLESPGNIYHMEIRRPPEGSLSVDADHYAALRMMADMVIAQLGSNESHMRNAAGSS